MARKKNWVDRLKRFFSSETKSKQEKKDRRKRWLFGRLKSKCSPSLPAPRSLRDLRDAEQEQSKHAVAVAVATAAAAEAAVASAHAAAQVVRLTGTPLSYHQAPQIAAIKIQATFRGYLARRALRALKGLVKLQAVIRGQAVRRQTTITLRSLQSLMKIQSQARASRVRAVENRQVSEDRDFIHRKTKGSPQHNHNERRWDSSILSKEDIITLLNNRREAATKRERAMDYASSYQDQRRPTTPVSKEFDSDTEDRRWSWLEQWVDTQPLDKDIPEILPTPCGDHNSKEKSEEIQLRYLARRSFNRSQRSSLKDDDSFLRSPNFPGYMASTVSTNARFRSLSTPKQRIRNADSCSEQCTPCTDRLLSPIPSIVSDVGFSKMEKPQKSPGLKDTGPVKSHRSSNYHSFDSECSLLNWDGRHVFR